MRTLRSTLCSLLGAVAGDTYGGLVGLVLSAEQGSTTAAANVAWLLRRGAGQRGPGMPGGSGLTPAAAAVMSYRFFERCASQMMVGCALARP